MGESSRRVLHYRLAAYDEELGRCSPGLLLLMRMANEAADRGLARLDLGPGDEEYELHISSGHQVIATATACTGPAMASFVSGGRDGEAPGTAVERSSALPTGPRLHY